MADAKAAQTPLPTSYKPEPFDGTATVALQSQYQLVIGSLLYLMLGTCPDLAFAVTQMAKFAHNPSEEHLLKSKHILRYLAGTRKYALVYDGRSDQGYTPIVTPAMEMTDQMQIADVDLCRDTISPLRTPVSNGTLKHRL